MNFHGPIHGDTVVTGIHNETGGTTNFYFPSTLAPQAPLQPSSNVPFRKDDDFVERGDVLARITERCSRPAGRAALVGFGGFGYDSIFARSGLR